MLKSILAVAATALVAGCATYDYGYAGASYYDYPAGYYPYGYNSPYAYEPYYGSGYGPYYYAPPLVSGGVVIRDGGHDGDRREHARRWERGTESPPHARSGGAAIDARPRMDADRAPERDARAVSREAAAGGG
jgi:hypothetical protein